MTLPRSPEPKTAALEWLGKVPAHWRVFTLRRIAKRIQTGSTPSTTQEHYYEDGTVPWYGPSSFGVDLVLTHAVKFLSVDAVKEGAARLFSHGSAMIVTIGATAGKVGYIEQDCSCNQQITVVTFDDRKIVGKFGAYQLKSLEAVLRGIAPANTLPILNQQHIGGLPIAMPSLHEQMRIVAHIDCATARIDALIGKKQRQIELLQEKRAAMISHAVTKGLDPSVKLKESGVEWLGKIPAHWEIKRIKHIGSIKYGLGEPPELLDNGLPFIRATDIHRGIINPENIIKVDPDDVPWTREPELKSNDILVVRSGAYTGDSAIVPQEFDGAIAGYDMVLRVNKASSEFVAYALLSKYLLNGQIHLERSRAAQPHLNAEELGSCMIVLPPFDEQHEIASYLNCATEFHQKFGDRVQHSIEKLHEYRSAIISSAVTGKIDVRNEAA
jgi:type I restriction enzyme S subunit